MREHLLLTIYARLEAAGIRLAYPSQTVLFQGDGPGEDERKEDGKEEGGPAPRLGQASDPGGVLYRP